MKKQHSTKLAVFMALNLFLIGGLIIINQHQPIFDLRADDPLDCDDYFSQINAYTSIYEINEDLYSGSVSGVYKTWGTVTSVFTNSSGDFNFYIQSTDAAHQISGIHIYQSSLKTIAVGNVVTITGKPELYNNLPEFINPTIVVDRTTNPSPVIPFVTDASFWRNTTNSNSEEFLSAQAMGSRQVKVENATLNYVSSGNATLNLDGVNIPLYYASIEKTAAINSKVSTLSGQVVTVTGHLHSYIRNGVAKVQLLIREASEIKGTITVTDTLVLNDNNNSSVGSYSTGNYGEQFISSYEYAYYRAVNASGNLISLLPYVGTLSDGSAPGAFYNISSLDEITSIKINYYTNLSSGAAPTLSFGLTPLTMTTNTLPLSVTSTSQTFANINAAYFRVETFSAKLTIVSIEINTTQTQDSPSFTYLETGDKRINPVVYSGPLTEGATVTVPMDGYFNGSYFHVTESKIFTYYSFDYVEDNPTLAPYASYTDPSEIAAYYVAFKTWPANYVVKSNYNDARDVFGEEARCVSTYSRTDGYATAVPYQTGNNGVPLYHELDVDLDGTYSANSRGVGRVVVWEYGFDALNYDQSPVAVYTDDHYATFQEYLNTGSYGTRFNAEMTYSSYIWGNTSTHLIY